MCLFCLSLCLLLLVFRILHVYIYISLGLYVYIHFPSVSQYSMAFGSAFLFIVSGLVFLRGDAFYGFEEISNS